MSTTPPSPPPAPNPPPAPAPAPAVQLPPKLNRQGTIAAQLQALSTDKVDAILYATTTRGNLTLMMGNDQIPVFYRLMKTLNPDRDKTRTLRVVIHTNGGDGTVPWRLVSLIREYYGSLEVMVPYCAFSAGTLLALGADVIKMHPIAALGPTDPSAGSPFNPKDQFGNVISINVEDVSAYVSLVKEDVGITHEDELVLAMKSLTDQVHPLALGNVKRQTQQARILAERLIRTRNDAKNLDAHEIKDLVEGFTTRLFFHGHPISRMEARDYLNLQTVQEPTDTETEALGLIYEELSRIMELEQEFNPVDVFQTLIPTPQLNTWEMTPEQMLHIGVLETIHDQAICTWVVKIAGLLDQSGQTMANVVRLWNGWCYA